MSQGRPVQSAWALAALAACATEHAPDVAFLLPDDLEVPGAALLRDDGDGVVAVVPFDVLVYDPGSGAPLADLEVALHADVGHLLDADAVTSPQACSVCVWDTWSDGLVELHEAPSSTRVAVSDADGLVRGYVLVDSLPWVGEVTLHVQAAGVRAEAHVVGRQAWGGM